MFAKYAKFLGVISAAAAFIMPYLFAGYMVLTDKADMTDTLKAFAQPDPIYALSQQYVDDHKVYLVPNASAPIITSETSNAEKPAITEPKTAQEALAP